MRTLAEALADCGSEMRAFLAKEPGTAEKPV
jgi:hypothetical protein